MHKNALYKSNNTTLLWPNKLELKSIKFVPLSKNIQIAIYYLNRARLYTKIEYKVKDVGITRVLEKKMLLILLTLNTNRLNTMNVGVN